MTDHIPSPGSPEARRNGCRCDAKKNRDGHGIDTIATGRFWIEAPDCPMHGTPRESAPRCTETLDMFGGVAPQEKTT